MCCFVVKCNGHKADNTPTHFYSNGAVIFYVSGGGGGANIEMEHHHDSANPHPPINAACDVASPASKGPATVATHPSLCTFELYSTHMGISCAK